MSYVENCPTCGGKSKIEKDKDGSEITYAAIQDAEAFERVAQLKNALIKSSNKLKALQKKLKAHKKHDFGP